MSHRRLKVVGMGWDGMEMYRRGYVKSTFCAKKMMKTVIKSSLFSAPNMGPLPLIPTTDPPSGVFSGHFRHAAAATGLATNRPLIAQ